MSTALATTNTQTGVLQRIGNPEERGYLMEVYAEMLGIPASQAHSIEAQSCIAKAVQRSVQYGWQAGVHMHVVSFRRKAQPGERADSDGKVVSYELVDGEKGWWDSAARWRDERGIDWKPQFRDMTREELESECKLSGAQMQPGAYGVYCRIIVMKEINDMLSLYGIDERTPVKDRMQVVNALIDEIPWAAGIWTGKKKAGRYWNDDSLPTGVSSRDVAIRRAGKRALMQSSLTLIPLDNRTESQRIDVLTGDLRTEAQHIDRNTALIAQRESHPDNPDDDILFATDHGASAAADEPEAEWRDADEPESKPTDFATPEQVKRVNELGNAVYGDGWGDKAAEMLPKVGGGHAETFEEITQAQANVLISGLEKRAPQPA